MKHDDENRMWCNNCKQEFENSDTGYTCCDYGVGAEEKHVDICPNCESDDIEMLPLCDVCNDRHAAHGEEVCSTCLYRVSRIVPILQCELSVSEQEAKNLLSIYFERRYPF